MRGDVIARRREMPLPHGLEMGKAGIVKLGGQDQRVVVGHTWISFRSLALLSAGHAKGGPNFRAALSVMLAGPAPLAISFR
ncbi:hypothetical protein GCM10017322_15900 [Paracoccus aerius]|nr:hypothetical protein GCM10017322_15900 [Paracoccus aerius]